MNTRKLVLVLLLVPMILLGYQAWQGVAGRQPLLPAFDPTNVGYVEISHEDQRVGLLRDGKGWIVSTAARAPADNDKIQTLLTDLQGLSGKSVPAPSTAPVRAPITVVARTADGVELARMAFWSGAGQALPDGPRLALEKLPSLPVWASAWSSLKAPKIMAGDIVKVERIEVGAISPLNDMQAAEVGQILSRLVAKDFAVGSEVNWSDSVVYRVTLVSGDIVDVAQVADGEGRYLLRLASDTHEPVREGRRFAFRTSVPLP